MAVTIASLQSHGVRQLLVYCLGKREGDWPCHHQETLPIGRFRADEILGDIESRCRCTVCGWRGADLRRDYSKQQARGSALARRIKHYLLCTNLGVLVPSIPRMLDCWEAIDEVAQVLTVATSCD